MTWNLPQAPPLSTFSFLRGSWAWLRPRSGSPFLLSTGLLPAFRWKCRLPWSRNHPVTTQHHKLGRIWEQNPGSYHNPPSCISETNCTRLENGLTQVHTVSQFPRLLLALILLQISSSFYIFEIYREKQTNLFFCHTDKTLPHPTAETCRFWRSIYIGQIKWKMTLVS